MQQKEIICFEIMITDVLGGALQKLLTLLTFSEPLHLLWLLISNIQQLQSTWQIP